MVDKVDDVTLLMNKIKQLKEKYAEDGPIFLLFSSFVESVK